jgi:V/A-type H+/Na+-transporting ATPase subunit I
MAGYRLWFYRIPHRELKKVNKLTDPRQLVAKDHGFAYVVVISKQEPRPEILPVPRTHAGEVPLDKLKQTLQRVELKFSRSDRR